jgi:hypothetical protein
MSAEQPGERIGRVNENGAASIAGSRRRSTRMSAHEKPAEFASVKRLATLAN